MTSVSGSVMAESAPQGPGSQVPGPKPGPSPSPSPSPSKVQDEPKLNGAKANEGPQENSTRTNQGPQENSTRTNQGPQENSTRTNQGPETEPREEAGPQSGPQSSPEEDPEAQSDCVLCDSCIDAPRPALKSCLTCLVSYCEAHLRPHLENPKFSQHRLVDPLRDIERKTCEVHHRDLAWFCLPDRLCVCEGCVADEHRGHEVLAVEQARRQIERELKQKQSEMVQTVTAAENAISKLQNNTISIENSVSEARSVVDAQVEQLSVAVERVKRALVEFLEAEEKQAVQQADGIRVHLENRLSDLRKTQAQVQKISRNKNHLDFLQEYSEWKADGADTSLPGVYIGLMGSLKSFSNIITESTKKLCCMMDSEFTEKVKQACSKDESGLGIKTTVRTMVAAKHNQNLPDPQTRADLLQYAKSFSFDANTTHKFLRLTEENRKVTNTTPWQHAYAEHEERFEHWRQVLAFESVYLDRAYYELEPSGEGTYLGLAYKSIERKGSEANSCLRSADAAWCLQWSGKSLSAWHGDVETPLAAIAPGSPRFSRLGVYVDHSGGRLRFYGLRAGERDGEENLTLLHEYRGEFREPLYPAFWLSKKENAVTLVAPGEPLKSASPPATPPTPPPTTTQGNPTSNTANNANNNNNVNGGSKTTADTTTTTTGTTATTTITTGTTTTKNTNNTTVKETGKKGVDSEATGGKGKE